MAKDTILNIRISADLKAELQAAAEREGRTVSGYVTWLIRQAMRDGDQEE